MAGNVGLNNYNIDKDKDKDKDTLYFTSVV